MTFSKLHLVQFPSMILFYFLVICITVRLIAAGGGLAGLELVQVPSADG